MPESGEWFSPRTRPEMLSSDDPPERTEKPAQILPGPGSRARRTLRPAYRAAVGLGRAVPAFGRVTSVVPAVGRRLGIDHPNSRQRAAIWATGTAVAAATGLAVAAAVVGAPTVVSEQFDRLSVLPGLGDAAQDAEGSGVPVDDVTGQPSTRTDGRVAGPADARSGSTSTGSVTSNGPVTSYGYSLPGVPAGAPLPAGVTGATTTGPTAGGPGVPAVPGPVRTTRPAPGVPTAPGGGTTTAPPPVVPPVDPTVPTVDPTVPTVDPTTDPPVEPTTPPVEPTTPPPPPENTTPPDSPPTVEPPADDPPADGNTPAPGAQPPAATPTP